MPFMDADFLLKNKTARMLFDACAFEPIFDYHCHLVPKEIAENKQSAMGKLKKYKAKASNQERESVKKDKGMEI